jgi:hypothetical protein
MMLNPPKTLEEAQAYVYGKWAANPWGRNYKEGYCAYVVHPTHEYSNRQCQRKNGHGSDDLYCKQHARILVKRREVFD